MKEMAQDLLTRLKNCSINFDAAAEHSYGTIQAPRVATLNLDLYNDLCSFLDKIE